MEIFLEQYDDYKVELWEGINLSAENSSFLSSIDWINFQKSLGKEIDQFLIYIDLNGKEYLIGNLYIEIYKRRIAKFAYSPYGPVISFAEMEKDFEITEKNEFLTEVYKQLRAWFLKYIEVKGLNLFRFDPLISSEFKPTLEALGYKKSLAPAQAIDTWVMDLKPELSDEEFLTTFKKDTRYYIKRAEKLGVNILKSATIDHVQQFGKLMSQTTERKNFGNHSTKYFVRQWQLLGPLSVEQPIPLEAEDIQVAEPKNPMTEVFLARVNGKYISGALFNYYKDTAYYAHGASTSDPELMKLSSPYLLHWEIMKDARSKGFKKYNFWGIVPKELLDHVWRGLSDFKMKFNGEMVSYVGPYEVGGSGMKSKFKWNLQRAFDWYSYRKERY